MSHGHLFQFHRLLITVSLLAATAIHAAELTVAPDRTNGIYAVGQTVHWRVEWNSTNPTPSAQFQLLSGGKTVTGDGSLEFSNNVAVFESKFTEPGTVLVKVKSSNNVSFCRAIAGAVAAPERIAPAARPADFDAFWKGKLAELKKIPANPQLERVDFADTNLAYWKITMDNIRGTHIHGQLARTARGKKFPALLILQWAGVYGLEKSWVTNRANEGWLTLNIMAHDLPIDESREFYRKQNAGPLKGYADIGNENRETNYYLRMYLSCVQALEYLTRRDDWDRKTLVVMGGSQGGRQTLMLAGLHPKQISAAIASVPGGCDTPMPEAGRQSTRGKDPKKIYEADRYFDIANFASRIRCPVLVGVGLHDEICPPAGILAAFNQISARKEIVIMPRAGHMDMEDGVDTHAAFKERVEKAWLPAMLRGEAPPIHK